MWFGNIVVELLAHGEGLFERRSGVVHGSGEWRSLGLPEFLDRQDQLVGAGAHRVVHLDDDRARQVVKGVNRHRCQRGGIGRVDILGGRDIGGVALGPSAAAPHHQRRDHQESDTDDDQHWYQRETATLTGALAEAGQSCGGCCRRTCPVVIAQRRLDAITADIVDLRRAAAGRGRRHQEGIGTLPGGHRQNGVLIAQIADGAGLLCPADRALGGEGVDEHHPQPHATFVVELVNGFLHVRELPIAEHSGVVGDGVGEPKRGLGPGGGGEQGGGHQDRGEQTEQTMQAHDRQCSSPGGDASKTSSRSTRGSVLADCPLVRCR